MPKTVYCQHHHTSDDVLAKSEFSIYSGAFSVVIPNIEVCEAALFTPKLLPELLFLGGRSKCIRKCTWSRSGAAPRPDVDGRDDVPAAEIARRAYARGEINRERFLEVMADLKSNGPPRAEQSRI